MSRKKQPPRSLPTVPPQPQDSHFIDYPAIDALLRRSRRHAWLALLAICGLTFTLSAMAMLG